MDPELSKRAERALAGNLHSQAAKLADQGKLFVRDRLALLLDDGSFVEDALLANTMADDLPADGVVTGVGRVDGRPGGGRGQRPHREGGVVGCPHRREDRARHRARAAARAAGVLARRLGRCADHRSGGALPGPPRRGAHLLQPGAPVRPGAADLLPVRAERGRRRLHPELLRHRDHGGGQRLHVPRLATHGRDGDRGADDPRGDGRRPHARHGVGLRRQPRGRRRRRHRAGQGGARLPAADLARGTRPCTSRRRRRTSSPPSWCRRRTPRATTCTPSSTVSSTPRASSR